MYLFVGRRDTAIPILESSGIEYYNPQVDDWNAELVILEGLAKTHSQILVFVIDSETRSIASMIEAAEFITAERDVILIIKDITANTTVNNEIITVAEAKDINRGRAYLADVAHRHLHVGVFINVKDACEYIVKKSKQKKEELNKLVEHHNTEEQEEEQQQQEEDDQIHDQHCIQFQKENLTDVNTFLKSQRFKDIIHVLHTL